MKINNFAALLTLHHVIIPPIQRDYAQGRSNEKVKRIRDRFLDKMVSVLGDEYAGVPLKLDFIYGYVNKENRDDGSELSVFKPLDGQQRLTTLFLVHWFVAAKEDRLDQSITDLLAKFSYATRAKSRQFCEKLVQFKPTLGSTPITSQIENQPWFFASWFKDPTIASMLVVLDAIETKLQAKKLDDVWGKLTGSEPRILFHLLEMEDLGLPDDLYIKMNSRGKELTDFEHFKSQFSRILKGDRQKEFNRKIDGEWSELFWTIVKDKKSNDLARQVDSGFLSFFWYITDLLRAKSGITSDEDYWLAVVETIYSDDQHVAFLFSCLDLFTKQEKSDHDYFDQFFYIDESHYEHGKTRLFFNNARVNLFHKCVETYGYGNRRGTFSLGEQLMLYACILNQAHHSDNFHLNIRKIRNLIASSEDQIRKEYLGALYQDVERIVRNDALNEKTRFSKAQLSEEAMKFALQDEDTVFEEVLFRLEDHHLLRGTLSIFEINNKIGPYAQKFQSTFHPDCDYDLISQAMLTFGDYSQGYGRLRRLGNRTSSTWRELFTPSEYRKHFSATQRVLKGYLQLHIENGNISNEEIVSEFKQGSKNWRYYYLKYENFRAWNGHETNGYYYWHDYENRPFECYMMFRKQFNGRHWNPYLLEVSNRNTNCSLENYGAEVQFTCGNIILMITAKNNAFSFSAHENDTDSLNGLSQLKQAGLLNDDGDLIVEQTTDNEDSVDRIQTCLGRLEGIEQFFSSSRNLL